MECFHRNTVWKVRVRLTKGAGMPGNYVLSHVEQKDFDFSRDCCYLFESTCVSNIIVTFVHHMYVYFILFLAMTMNSST